MSIAQDVYHEITLTRPACGNEVPYSHYVAVDKIGVENSAFGKYHARLIKTQVVHHPLVHDGGLTTHSSGDLKLDLLVNGKPFFVHRDDELLCSFESDISDLEKYAFDFWHPRKNYQQVLLDVRSDSAIKEVAFDFHFPNDVCANGEYPDGFAVLYESDQGKLPDLPHVTDIIDTPGIDIWDVPEDELLLQQGKNVVTVHVQDEFEIDCGVSGVESPFDNSYQIIVQAPLGSFGVDVRIVSEHAVQIHRYWLNL